MLQVKLDTGFNIEVDFAISPFHKRLFAWIIDLLTCWLYIKIVSLIVDVPSFFVWTYTTDVKAISGELTGIVLSPGMRSCF